MHIVATLGYAFWIIIVVAQLVPQLAIVCIMTWSVDNIITEIKDVGELLHFKKQNGAKNIAN